MKAELLLRERIDYQDGAFIEMKVWRVPTPVPPSEHDLKYSLVYIVDGQRIVGYDNERGKGDHRHHGPGGAEETQYEFRGVRQLIADFRAEVLSVRGSI